MSAAWENAKKGWIVASFSFCTSIIGVVISQNMSDNSINKREAEKANKEFQIELDAKLDKKADLEYVDKRFIEAEKIQNAYFQGISDMFVVTQQQLKDIKEDIRSIRK